MAFAYNPATGLLDVNVYPTNPTSETAARQQFMDLFNQVRDHLNNSTVNSLSSSGYQKLIGGLIIQWGSFYLSSGLGNGNIKPTVLFPISFPTAVLNIQTTPSVDDTEAPNINTPTVDRPSVAVNGFNLRLYRENASLGGNVFWFAIGY